jgi:hypothetical protein
MWNGLAQTEKRKNKQDDDDKPHDINYSIHDDSPPAWTNGHAIIHSHNSSAVPKFLPVCRTGALVVACCTAPIRQSVN